MNFPLLTSLAARYPNRGLIKCALVAAMPMTEFVAAEKAIRAEMKALSRQNGVSYRVWYRGKRRDNVVGCTKRADATSVSIVAHIRYNAGENQDVRDQFKTLDNVRELNAKGRLF